jgi:hypothetical protein
LLFLRAVKGNVVGCQLGFSSIPSGIGQEGFERGIFDEDATAIDYEAERAIVPVDPIHGSSRSAETPGGVFDGDQIWLRTVRGDPVPDACCVALKGFLCHFYLHSYIGLVARPTKGLISEMRGQRL